jgi:hypothetical protein
MPNPSFFLQLMIGPGVPVPMPRDVMDALVSVSVTSDTENASSFELKFSLTARSPLNTLFLLSSGVQIPLVRVVIMVISKGLPDVLMDGVMTHHQIQPGTGGAPSTLTVIGDDLSKAMSYLKLDGMPYPAQPPHTRVLLMLAKYIALGVTPVVIPSFITDVPDITERIPGQRGTDLEYIKELARLAGYEFYVDPGPLPLQSIAYWGPSVRIGIPQPALNTNMDAHTNVEAINFSFDSEGAGLPIVMIYPKSLKVGIPIPIPNLNPLRPPLGLIPPLPKNSDIDRDSARRSPGEALLAGLARAAESADAVTAEGTLDVARYGRALKARKLVGVRGAGTAFDGLYFVKKVKHSLKHGEYKQEFSLVRNGLVSITPRVPA